MIDDDGTIYRRRRNGTLRPVKPARSGYVQLTTVIDGRKVSCQGHRLAWHTKVGPIEPGLTLDHLNRVKCDNRIENLEPCTSAENTFRAAHGALNARARLSEADVLAVRRRRAEGESCADLADEFSVTGECIRLIFAGKRWRTFLATHDESRVAA